MNHELAKTLTTALVQFIDRERPEGTMCCSSYECEKIEKAFEGGTYDVVEKLIQGKLLDMTEFELEVSDIVEYCKEHGENVAFDYAKRHAKTLLALARKQLLSYADESNPAIEAMADLDGKQMIKELKGRIVGLDNNGNPIAAAPPDIPMIVEKVNEIIRYLNATQRE